MKISRIAISLLAVALPVTIAVPTAVAAPVHTSNVAVAPAVKKPPLKAMVLTESEITSVMWWTKDIEVVEGPTVKKYSAYIVARGTTELDDSSFAGVGIDLFSGSDKQFDKEAKKTLKKFGLAVDTSTPGYSWSGKGVQDNGLVLYVNILNLGKGFSVTGMVFAPQGQSEMAQTSRMLEAKNLAGKQANKVYDFGYGILGH